MNCDECKQILVEGYFDDEVAAEICRQVQVHLQACGPCSVEVDSLRKTVLIWKQASPCPELKQATLKRLYAVLSYEYPRPEDPTTT